MHVVRDDTMPVPGYEHHTFMCSACSDIERRLVFTRSRGPSHAEEPLALQTPPAPPTSPAPAGQKERITAASMLRRVFATLSGVWHEGEGSSRSWEPMSAHPPPPTSTPPAEPVAVLTTAPASVPSKASNDLNEIEALVGRASGAGPDPTRITETDEGRGTSSEVARSASVSSVPHTSVSAEQRDKELDECEVLLLRAIEMVREPTRSSQITKSVTEARSEIPCDLASSMQAERPPASRVVVQIHHDLEKAKYIAKDTKSGLSILRHQDSARLRAMCDRMGWQVIEDVSINTA
jgi:hypothetical protein